MKQGSLFPDGHEVWAVTVEALATLELGKARELLRTAVGADAETERVRRAVDWLGQRLGEGGAREIAAAFRSVPAARATGALERGSAARVDEALARCGVKRAASGAWLDPDGSVPLGALHLVLGNPRRAWEALWAAVERGGATRGDVWGYLADACSLLGEARDAAAAYARALACDAGAVDLARCRDARLSALFERLTAERGEPLARELLLPRAWCEGLVEIDVGGEWIERHGAHVERLASRPDGASERDRARCFGAWFFLDRSLEGDNGAVARRNTLLELAPEEFERVMTEVRRRERSGGRRLTF